MDYRKLIADAFGARCKKLDLMARYAEFHANSEIQAASLTAIAAEKPSTLGVSLRILNKLKIKGKTVHIVDNTSTPAVYTPTHVINVKLEFDPHDFRKNELENMLYYIAEKECIKAISDELKNAAEIHIGVLAYHMQVMSEAWFVRPVFNIFNRYKITPKIQAK